MIRSPGGAYAAELVEKKLVGIGWGEPFDEFSAAKTPSDFYNIVRKHWTDYTDQQVINAGRQLYKFFREIKNGDEVITYDSARRIYHFGTIKGDVQHQSSLIGDVSNFRPVNWKAEIARDSLSLDARNSLGSTLTLFRPSDEAASEIRKLSAGIDTKPLPAVLDNEVSEAVETEEPFAKAYENSQELIKDRLMKLSWQDMQRIVAGVLRAMGYKTKISADGPDRGKDIIASPDGLALEHPRIFVEVKHRKGVMGAPEIRKFIGGRDHQNDRCLYVSTGGFTIEAKYEAERAKVPLTLVDSDELVNLLVENYEAADSELRSLIPLRKTYWPIT